MKKKFIIVAALGLSAIIMVLMLATIKLEKDYLLMRNDEFGHALSQSVSDQFRSDLMTGADMSIVRLARSLSSKPLISYMAIADVDRRMVVVDTRVSSRYKARYDDFIREFLKGSSSADSLSMKKIFDSLDNGQWTRIYLEPIKNDDQVKGVLVIGLPMKDIADQLQYLERATIFAYLAVLIMAMVGILFWHKKHEAETKAVEAQINQQSYRAREEERKRIARDLHDNVAQVLSAIYMQAARINKQFDPGSKAFSDIKQLSADIKGAIGELRKAIGVLREEQSNETLDIRLRTIADKFSKENKIQATVVVDCENLYLPQEATSAVLAIADEALRNIAKHAGSKWAKLTLTCNTGEARLIIEDGGIGFNVDKARQMKLTERKFGIIGMEERAHSFGGSLEIVSESGKGSMVTLAFDIGE